MYLPDHFAEHNPAILHRLIAEHPLGTLVTLSADGLTANHLPLPARRRRGRAWHATHVARGNHVWHDCWPITKP